MLVARDLKPSRASLKASSFKLGALLKALCVASCVDCGTIDILTLNSAVSGEANRVNNHTRLAEFDEYQFSRLPGQSCCHS
jgi:hypothetical protein